MSAGSGIAHSEFNASLTEPVEFLQIWIRPARGGGAPRYEQAAFDTIVPGLRCVVSPDGRDGSLTIGQNMCLHRLLWPAGGELTYTLERKRAWVQLIRGALVVNGAGLYPGDGLAIDAAEALQITGRGAVEALLFDLI